MLWEGSTIGKFKFNFEVFDVLTARDADIFLLLNCLVHFTDYVLFSFICTEPEELDTILY